MQQDVFWCIITDDAYANSGNKLIHLDNWEPPEAWETHFIQLYRDEIINHGCPYNDIKDLIWGTLGATVTSLLTLYQ